MYYPTNNGGKRLLQYAVPTIFNVPNPPPLVGCKRKSPVERHPIPIKKRDLPVIPDNISENKMSFNEINSNKFKKLLLTLRVKNSRLRKKLQHLKSKQRSSKNCDGSIKHILKLSKKYLSPIQVSFLNSQLQMSKRVSKGKRWAVCDKVLALRILFRSPQTFNLLRTIFCLPSQTCLMLFLSRVFADLQEGFSSRLFSMLKLRAEAMNPFDRNVSLVMDEMSLKQHLEYDRNSDIVYGMNNGKLLNQALVIMVRGLANKWKQPIAYFYNNSTVSTVNLAFLLRETISKVQETGLHIRCIVCDQGSTNIAALRLLGFSKNSPYFPNPSHDKNIHVIFDPPHLVKSIRNNLRRHDININGEIVSWQHIQSLYNLDKINSVRLVPKLTDRHLDPGPLLSMKVKLATQVFSYQVASALNCCSKANLLPLSVIPTARFVERMDTIFDILNLYKLSADKPACCALTSKGASISQLEGFQYWIKKWKFCGVRSQANISCHWGLSVTIDSVLTLSRELFSEGFQFVCTSRFNQDCIENFFSIIRSKGGWNDRPNVRQFRAAYRNALLLLSLEKSKSNSNCIKDSKFETAFNVNDFMKYCNQTTTNCGINEVEKERPKGFSYFCPGSFYIFTGEILMKPMEQALLQMAVWLVQKVKLCHRCADVLVLSSTNNPPAFMSLVFEMETTFMNFINVYLERKGLAIILINEIKKTCNFQFLYAQHEEHALYLEKNIAQLFVVTRAFIS
jgi:hypothetical protein